MPVGGTVDIPPTIWAVSTTWSQYVCFSLEDSAKSLRGMFKSCWSAGRRSDVPISSSLVMWSCNLPFSYSFLVPSILLCTTLFLYTHWQQVICSRWVMKVLIHCEAKCLLGLNDKCADCTKKTSCETIPITNPSQLMMSCSSLNFWNLSGKPCRSPYQEACPWDWRYSITMSWRDWSVWVTAIQESRREMDSAKASNWLRSWHKILCKRVSGMTLQLGKRGDFTVWWLR